MRTYAHRRQSRALAFIIKLNKCLLIFLSACLCDQGRTIMQSYTCLLRSKTFSMAYSCDISYVPCRLAEEAKDQKGDNLHPHEEALWRGLNVSAQY